MKYALLVVSHSLFTVVLESGSGFSASTGSDQEAPSVPINRDLNVLEVGSF